MNRFQQASARLSQRLLDRASSLVTYSRGTTVLTDIQAVIGQTVFAFVNSMGMDERVRSRDYVLKVSDLVTLFEKPMRGDRINYIEDGINYTCEVLPPNDEQEYRSLDGFVETYRIHTKIVKQEPV